MNCLNDIINTKNFWLNNDINNYLKFDVINYNTYIINNSVDISKIKDFYNVEFNDNTIP